MATKYANILGIRNLREPTFGEKFSVAELTLTMPAYTASSDNGQIGGGGTLHGASVSTTLKALIEGQRRDGKTVTLKGATLAGLGKEAAVEFGAASFAVATNNLTFNLVSTDLTTEIDAASGVDDRAIVVAVVYEAA